MHRGYTKRWRKRWDKDYCKDHLLWVMMSYFIDHANYKDSEVYFPNCGLIPLKRGQHIFGTKLLAEKLGVDRQRVRTKLKILKNIEFLTIKSTNKFSIATILNYSIYNPDEVETNHQTNQQLTNNQPATNQQLTTPNKEKKEKNNIIPYVEIVSTLNKKAGTNFKPTTKNTQKHIRARWNEGFTLDDFIQVINKKTAQWKTDPKMMEYLRPETLFGSKFESYLNSKGGSGDERFKDIDQGLFYEGNQKAGIGL